MSFDETQKDKYQRYVIQERNRLEKRIKKLEEQIESLKIKVEYWKKAYMTKLNEKPLI